MSPRYGWSNSIDRTGLSAECDVRSLNVDETTLTLGVCFTGEAMFVAMFDATTLARVRIWWARSPRQIKMHTTERAVRATDAMHIISTRIIDNSFELLVSVSAAAPLGKMVSCWPGASGGMGGAGGGGSGGGNVDGGGGGGGGEGEAMRTVEASGALAASIVTSPPNQLVLISAGDVLVSVLVTAAAEAEEDVRIAISMTIEPELTVMVTSITPTVVLCSCERSRVRNALSSNEMTSPASVNCVVMRVARCRPGGVSGGGGGGE